MGTRSDRVAESDEWIGPATLQDSSGPHSTCGAGFDGSASGAKSKALFCVRVSRRQWMLSVRQWQVISL